MNAKENALRIIRFDQPERVVPHSPCTGVGYLGVNHEGYRGGGHDVPVGTAWTDVWGTTWRRELDGVMGFPRVHPLADFPAALQTYAWPDPDDERICGRIYEQARSWKPEEQFLAGSHRETLWEKSYMLVGMETLMMAFHAEPNAVRELLHRIMDFDLAIAAHYLKAGVELAGLGDDLGTQRGLLLSPETIHGFLVPEYRRLCDLYRCHNVFIAFHSCGAIGPLVETFIELGVSILNPIQCSAIDLDRLRRVTQGRMALEGGISSARIVSGPKEKIRQEVARRILQLGESGGYFCNADQGMPWPAEHLQAMIDAIDELGRYPLDQERLSSVACAL